MPSETVAIVDYGMGNLLSVRNALEMVGADARICAHPEDLDAAERIVLPGVGAFPDCMKNLRARGFEDALNRAVQERGRPILGICLGMQAMARRSSEGTGSDGLGWLDAEVERLQPGDPALRVPQIGWNDLEVRHAGPLLAGIRADSDFYFVHSYHVRCRDESIVDAVCEYGGAVTAVVSSGNIAATQFHPEKSQQHGLRLLENFLRWRP